MREAVIVAATRTPVGKAVKGSLAETRPDDLAAAAVRGLLARLPAFDAARVDDLILGCAFPEGEQGMNLARQVVFLSGLPDSTTAMTVNRFCASGLEALHLAALKIAGGAAECVIAGGAESMSLIPLAGGKFAPSYKLAMKRPESYLSMGLTAERVAAQDRIRREDQDAFALQSHRRAVAAKDSGRFDAEITPVKLLSVRPGDRAGEPRRGRAGGDARGKRGHPGAGDTGMERAESLLSRDEGPRADTTLEALAKLKPVFQQGGTVTAGNSSGINDGASAVLVVEAERARGLGLRPMARIVSTAVAGVHPDVMGIGPVPAVRKALERAGIGAGDLDLVELNEAFASQSVACMDELGLDPTRVNPNGGAIALGHPLGASGARLMTMLVHELARTGGRYGLAAMCIGVGQGIATIVERVED